MVDINTLADEIKNREQIVLKNAMDFFKPLKKRYCTKHVKYTYKKSILNYIRTPRHPKMDVKYLPLNINICGFDFTNIVVSIKFEETYSNLSTKMTDYKGINQLFKSDIFFRMDNESILDNPHIKKFMQLMMIHATPLYTKWECLVNHIQDIDIKIYIAEKLEELELSGYKGLSPTPCPLLFTEIVNKINSWENEYKDMKNVG